VVRDFVAQGFTGCDVVIDNGANEKKALNAKAAASLQSLTGTYLIRVPYFSQRLNLGIQDIMHKCFLGSDRVGHLHTIIGVLPKGKWRDDLDRMPMIMKPHWPCIGEVTDYIAQRYPRAYQLMASMTFTARSEEHAEAVRLFRPYNFRDISECCAVVNNLIQWSETEATRLCMVWPTLAVTCGHLDGSTQLGNVYAHLFKQYLQE
jgi:hypothetical protein